MIPPIEIEKIEALKDETSPKIKPGCFFCGRTVKQEKKEATNCNRLFPVMIKDIDLDKTINFSDLKNNPRDIVKHDWQPMPPR